MAASFQIFSSSSVILPSYLCSLDINSTVNYTTKKKGRGICIGKGRKYKKIEKKAHRRENTKVQGKRQKRERSE
jgi:hypothetical protein